MKIIVSAIAILVILILVPITSYISAVNYSADIESRIEAEWENNKQILGQYSLKVAEAAQIPNMQTEDLVKIFTESNKSRYGESGSKASFQWLQENNPTLDQTTYLKVQQLIESGRNKFENSQTKLLDAKRQYKKALKTFWRGMWLGIAEKPSIDLNAFNIITSAHSDKSFTTGTDTVIKLR